MEGDRGQIYLADTLSGRTEHTAVVCQPLLTFFPLFLPSKYELTFLPLPLSPRHLQILYNEPGGW
jgi:hypothetical protein